MPFFSAIAQDDITRRTDSLLHQGETGYWLVVPVVPGVELHFKLLNSDPTFNDAMDRIISGLTESAVVHVETFVDGFSDGTTDTPIGTAESLLGLPYDYFGAFMAGFDRAATEHTGGKWFCSAMAWKIVQSVVQTPTAYPNPGRLLMEVVQALGLQCPRFTAVRPTISEDDIGWLYSLDLATGIKQQIEAAIGAAA